jgi:hypothetical protein
MLAVMGALKDLWQSERGLVTIALLVSATVLVITGHITSDQWLAYTRWAAMAYIASKTVTGAVAIATSSPPVTASSPDTASDPDRAGRLERMDKALKMVENVLAPTVAPATPPDKAS